ncbi:hypothetical protein [Flavobacterium terrisoli]|uniref:hypothetical protein n=1 Tax=Flavobacterium terrisoli TaxID=3242195 RepID=UPI002543D96B|nr:hypothetical protein [Flavobacterium buctense]
MRNILLILLFLGQSVFCQEYHFDRFVQYKETSFAYQGYTFTTVYFNSKNPSYYLVNRSWNSQINAYIVDNITNTTHNFFIEDLSKNKEYAYLNSKKFNPADCEIDCSKNSIEEANNAGQFTKITYNEFTNAKKKRKDYEIEVIVKPSEFTCLKPLIRILQHHFLFCEELTTTDNSLPVSAKLTRGKEIRSEQKLEATGNIDLDFSVKKESIKYTTTN